VGENPRYALRDHFAHSDGLFLAFSVLRFRARSIVSQLVVTEYMSENLKRRIAMFQGGCWIAAHPNPGRDLIRRRDLDPFDEHPVRYVSEKARTWGPETHACAKNAPENGWSRSKIP
jgi:hypothetical protein